MTHTPAENTTWKGSLENVQSRDRHRLVRQSKSAKSEQDKTKLANDLAVSVGKTQARLAARDPIELLQDLPISQRAQEIADAVSGNQVVVVCGETGSGKTTQLPKILMQLGLGARGLIGHTQPRRLAARSVAERIAQEIGTPFGQLVGFKTRFDDRISENTQVKLMTDGILLAETARDRFLNHYEAIIIDEAHERTLNVDFLLGYLKQLLPQRPDLKIIITSATIDPLRFSKFFSDAPVINVAGRGYPVEMRYRPPGESDDVPQSIEAGVRELWREGPGDILVFLPGERDIRDAERHLSKALANSKFSGAEVVPLYSRLNRSAQQRIFSPSGGRRVVLATNVAETSLTVPGIRYVIDTGLARISRYSTTAKVQRLPIEPVAQASCNQRAGRCGRVAPGICIRLFEQDDFAARSEFTDPEIRRTNLASVLLTMADLRLGEIEKFPFIDPPERRFIQDGRRLLEQLQALKSSPKKGNTITPLGRKLARLPLDPRIGRMLLAADEQGVLPAMRVLAAGLTIQDPRERPAAARQAADQAQASFADNRSDFIGLLKLWDEYTTQKKQLSGSQLRKWCHEKFLNFMRLREWEDLVRQLRRIGAGLDLSKVQASGALAKLDYAALHRALLPGLLDYVGRFDEGGEYLGARGRRFRIFPGSALAKRSPKWIVAGELLETSQLFAHKVAGVEPEWIEKAAAHLVKHEYYEPHWEKKRGHAVARERVKLFGLTLAEGRKVDYSRIDPAVAREIFIRDGLVAFELTDNRGRAFDFLLHNQAIVDDIAAQEARFRRRDLLVDEVSQAAFYDEFLPDGVCNRKTLHTWIKEQGDAALRFSEEGLLRNAGLALPEQAFPEILRIGSIPIRLSYRFEPGDKADGVTARVPLPVLNQFPAERADWLVPGLIEEKIREYLKALPKSQRRAVVPVPDFARAITERLTFGEGNLQAQVRAALLDMTGLNLAENCWQAFAPTPHLQMRIEVIDEHEQTLAVSRDLESLRSDLGARAREAVQAMPDNDIEQTGLTQWPENTTFETVTLNHGGVKILALPTLIDRGDTVDLQLIDDAEKAHSFHRQGVIRLLILDNHKASRFLKRELDDFKVLAALPLEAAPETALVDPDVIKFLKQDRAPALLADLLHGVVALRVNQVPRTHAEFSQLAAEVSAHIAGDAVTQWNSLRPALKIYAEVRKRLSKGVSLEWINAVEDIKDQLAHLIYPGCISQAPDPRHLERYMQAIVQRLDKLKQAGVPQDKARMRQIEPWWQAYKKRAEKVSRRGEPSQALLDLRWMIEEYRVQIFAQPLGTATKVSPQRLQQALDDL